MARKCIVCKKELPEGSKLPVCEYHKGVAAENAKNAVVGAAVVVVTVGVTARDAVGPILKEKGPTGCGKSSQTYYQALSRRHVPLRSRSVDTQVRVRRLVARPNRAVPADE